MSEAGAKWDKELLLARSMTVRVHNGFKVISSDGEVVNCVDWRQSGTPLPPAPMSTQGTWQRVVDDLISSCGFHLGAGWLKSHVGFPGNELADSFAKYSASACIVTHFHLQHPT